MNDAPAGMEAAGSAELVNAVGLHARPSVKLTKLAKRFECRVEIALDPSGPWMDAKSPVKVMRVKAPLGAVVHVRAAGPGAPAAAAALLQLIRDGFGEEPHSAAGGGHG
ncbi:MAG TPA: HPr family phosphocarrier protein [Acetobacteraceae bacterium]|jgi:phosphocarrier protein|nr:HPr family phosphocarrier protein [Acetobacteraceae bacterium]